MSPSIYYPVGLDLKEKKCLVVGGGAVAARKVRTLLTFGARVTVLAPEAGKATARLMRAKAILHVKRKYWKGCLKGFFLVIAATDDAAVNATVARHAMAKNMLVNVVDVPALCNFIVPAVVRQGPLVIGISTSGQSPVVAQALKEKITGTIGQHYGMLVRLLGKRRAHIQADAADLNQRKVIYKKILNSPVLELLEQGKVKQAEKLIDQLTESKS